MLELIFKYVDLRQASWVGFVLVTVVTLALFVHGNSPAVQAQTASDDCFGGALSDDPIHCEVFEWAHNNGVIEVDAVYRAGKALYIYLTQTDHLDDPTLRKMLGKSQEVARRTGEHDCVLDSLLCAGGVLSAEQFDIPGYILPKSSVYQTIELFPGGSKARRSSPGWQVFQEFWPEAAGAGGATGTEGDFDISEVDRTNFPSLAGNCDALVIDNADVNNGCGAWDYYPGLGIANAYSDTWNDKEYYYVKAGVGEETAKITAAKTALMNSQPDYYTEDRLVVVAVPHDFEELWRWSLVLERFANSSGNTLGITHVRLGFNTLGGLGKDRQYLFPVEDAPDLTDYIREHEGFADGLRWRLIIQVETLEFEKTVAGLPQLVKQLEIPESAVGLVFEAKHEVAERGEPVPGAGLGLGDSPRDHDVTDVDVVGSGLRSWLVWAAMGVAVFAAGLGGLLAFRLRSASENHPTS